MRELARRIYNGMRCRGRTGKIIGRTREKMRQLYPADIEKRLEEYYVELIGLLLRILLIGLGIAAFCEFAFAVAGEKTVTSLERGCYGEGNRYAKLLAVRQDGVCVTKTLEVAERTYTEAELEKMYREILPLVEQQMLGDNLSLSQVSTHLSLPNAMLGYPFDISWVSSAPELVEPDGKIKAALLEERVVTLRATFRCQEFEQTKEWGIVLCQSEMTDEEKWELFLGQALKQTEEDSSYEDLWQLPGEAGGQSVIWIEKRENPAVTVVILTFLCMVIVPLLRKYELAGKLRERDRLLEEEYAGIVTKLTLYLGAGMTVKSAWKKTAEMLHAEGTYGAAVAEMRLSCRELDSGVYETDCYESFGKRCGRREYVKLGALLSQNLKKGNSELLMRLREEVRQAQEYQKHMARRKGEEAATKMLGPMMLMLAMVLVLIMLPAFGNF